jgi:nicotinate-nucleotide pyrophosphorylase
MAKGVLVGVDVVVGALEQGELDIDHREASQHAAGNRILQALVDRRNVLARHRTALDRVDELVALAGSLGSIFSQTWPY